MFVRDLLVQSYHCICCHLKLQPFATAFVLILLRRQLGYQIHDHIYDKKIQIITTESFLFYDLWQYKGYFTQLSRFKNYSWERCVCLVYLQNNRVPQWTIRSLYSVFYRIIFRRMRRESKHRNKITTRPGLTRRWRKMNLLSRLQKARL